MTFGKLRIGQTFNFVAEQTLGLGIATGPWIKISRRCYIHHTLGYKCQVGSIHAEVNPLPDSDDALYLKAAAESLLETFDAGKVPSQLQVSALRVAIQRMNTRERLRAGCESPHCESQSRG